jgi:hypothetical protein
MSYNMFLMTIKRRFDYLGFQTILLSRFSGVENGLAIGL